MKIVMIHLIILLLKETFFHLLNNLKQIHKEKELLK